MGVTGIVLAGGEGRRMGGVDKGQLDFQGKPLVNHVVERFSTQVDELLISANRNQNEYATLGYSVISDLSTHFYGPLAGLEAGMAAAQHDLVVTVPCDSPRIPLDFVARLTQALQDNHADIAVACSSGERHPVFCLCRRALLPSLSAFLKKGERKMNGWFATHKTIEVHFEDEQAFVNINTPEELNVAAKNIDSEPSPTAFFASNGLAPVLGFCAWGSGVGKTTLLTRLIPELNKRGVRVSVIKHTHHRFDIDQPGKDSYKLREAGAVQMLLGSSQRWALMTELSRIQPDSTQKPPETSLQTLLPQVDRRLVDLVLVEGFRDAAIPKIEIFRAELGHPLQAEHDPHIIAIASNQRLASKLPILELEQPSKVADFVVEWLNNQAGSIKGTPNDVNA